MKRTKKALADFKAKAEKRRQEKIDEAGIQFRMNPMTRTKMHQAIGLHSEAQVQVDLGWHETKKKAQTALDNYNG